MQIIEYPAKQDWEQLLERPRHDTGALEATVKKIMLEIKADGDKAVDKYSLEFDQVSVKDRFVTEAEWQAAELELAEPLKAAIRMACKNIEGFHAKQRVQEEVVETMPGIRCWRKSVPIEKVGLYIPGGTAPLFSTVLMLAVPAVIAGCAEIQLCSPPGKDGKLHPAILYAAAVAGVRRIAKVGGVQAIAAMAYGTETISRVDKIFGPGNRYVTCAKQLLQQEGVAIDMPAGPSELAVYADETANPDFVAADLLSQCEHGPDSQVILVTASKKLAEQVIQALDQQISVLPRKDIAGKALENSKSIIIGDAETAMELLNTYAPEHLILACTNAGDLVSAVRNAGSVFIGHFAPETAGDYASGTNHTLPTHGFARAYSGVSVDSFIKKISFQQISEEGLAGIAETLMQMARAEGLQAHAAAVEIRLKQMKKKSHDRY
ncbi:MAG: histidinol dehydrogenase [Bacteroidota bacterium]|nr:histidinol dehydrogenase [Bacteroidota bacterium]MDP4211912.1 histidinol dehydrogenase [Bacteroidota bacterium]MDP4249283.1 histidinol dehydrogenase [Bacteroidota bacterium]